MGLLAPGFLVAAPPLGDRHFEQSVVLLASHGDQGAFGWIINGRQIMTVSELIEGGEFDVECASDADITGTVRLGGPVGQDQIWLIFPTSASPSDLPGSSEIGGGLSASASRTMLEHVASGKGPTELVAVLGYAGWGPGQLEDEIRCGAWLPTDLSGSLVFDVPREEIWRASYARIGMTPMAFAGRVVGSA